MKIKIDIVNKRRFADVALLVDKNDFQDWVRTLRLKWKIDRPLSDVDYSSIYSHIWHQGKADAWSDFNKDIQQVREYFERSPNFDNVIMYAIAFNEIPDDLYASCYLDLIEDPDDPENEAKYRHAIIITPNTTVPDIRKTLAQYKSNMKKGLKQDFDGKNVDLEQYVFGPKYAPSPVNVDNIQRDREWYWLKKEGLSYGQIGKIVNKDRNTITNKGIREAIKSYKERLSKP